MPVILCQKAVIGPCLSTLCIFTSAPSCNTALFDCWDSLWQ